MTRTKVTFSTRMRPLDARALMNATKSRGTDRRWNDIVRAQRRYYFCGEGARLSH
jgi:hypothetical protein